MRVVVTSDDAPPPMHFGDYPHGAYWSAERRPQGQEDEPADYSVSGSVLRMMWDYGVRVPLWDAEGLLPEEPNWLRKALGLSDPLIEDLTRWGLDMVELDAVPSRGRQKRMKHSMRAPGNWRSGFSRNSVPGYRVKYHPW